MKLITDQPDEFLPRGEFLECAAEVGSRCYRVLFLNAPHHHTHVLCFDHHGNAQGVGLADVTTRRLFNRMKLEMTYPTGVTNTFLHLMKIPMIMDNDREAIQLALMCCPEAEDHDHMKMIRIPNTAHIGVIEISEGMLPLVENNPNFEVLTEPYDLPFDENGNLF